MNSPHYEIEKDVVFGEGDGHPLRCDIYRPRHPNGAAILMVHGGGWQQGNKEMLPPQAEVYCQWGFTCVAQEYRLRPANHWPAMIHDVKTGLRWLRSQADSLGFNPDKIAVHGNSAGAHLALLLAGTAGYEEFEGTGGCPGVSTAVAAVVAVYPPVEFFIGERTSGGTNAEALMTDPTAQAAAAASPKDWISDAYPPTFLLHGSGDKVVPVSASLNMYKALVDAGAVAEIHIYAEQPHGWARQPEWVKPTMDEAALFLDRYLVDPDKYRANIT